MIVNATEGASLGGVVISAVWGLVGAVWLFVLHDSGEGPLLW